MLLSRGGWLLAGLAALSVVLIAPDAGRHVSAVADSDFPQALLALASLVQLSVAGWVLLVIAAASLPGASGVARFVTPRLLRRALFAGAAGALALSPAHASRGPSPAHTTSHEHSLQGLRLPDRPSTSALTERSVVVSSGDTLWAITARSLPASATNAEIAAACARWYATNRAVIGPDPDLIHPGQHLIPPAGAPTTKDVP